MPVVPLFNAAHMFTGVPLVIPPTQTDWFHLIISNGFFYGKNWWRVWVYEHRHIEVFHPILWKPSSSGQTQEAWIYVGNDLLVKVDWLSFWSKPTDTVFTPSGSSCGGPISTPGGYYYNVYTSSDLSLPGGSELTSLGRVESRGFQSELRDTISDFVLCDGVTGGPWRYNRIKSQPTMDAGGLYLYLPGSSVVLNGAIVDSNGEWPSSTLWSIDSGPGGGIFSDASALDSLFTPDIDGTYTLRLTGTNSAGVGADTAIVKLL